MNAAWYILVAILFLTIVLGIVAMLKFRKNGGLTDYRALYIMGAIWMPLGIMFWINQSNPAFFVMGALFLFIGAKNKDKWDTQPEITGTKKHLLSVIFGLTVIAVAVTVLFSFSNKNDSPAVTKTVTNFIECEAAGNAIMESYPRQCRHDDVTYTENIGNELELTDTIRLNSPRPNQRVSSPLSIEGDARGTWFFEGDFPVVLTNWDGLIIAEGIATAQGEWMTEEFVPFTANLSYETPSYGERGSLILQKDNPSGLPENDAALEIPILFPQAPEPTVTLCKPEQRGAEICTLDYTPVCGKVNVQCVKAPCPPIEETFSNVCAACGNPLVESYTEGECNTPPIATEYKVEEVTTDSCNSDHDCLLPADYAIRSSCPYESRCIEGSCTIICPDF